MANNLTAIVRADTTGFAEEIKSAQYMVNKFTQEMKKSGSSVTNVTKEQATAYNRVVQGLNKVTNGSKTTKQAQKELQNQIQELKIQWANLSNEARKGEFGKSIASTLKVAQDQLKALNQQLDATSNKMKGSGKMEGLKSALNLGGIDTGAMESLAQAASNPYVLAGAAATAAAVSFVKYNNTLSEQTEKIRTLTNANDKMVSSYRAGISAISSTNNVDFDEVLQATNSLSKQMGISFSEASDTIALGMASGANATGELLDIVKEYPAYLKEAGVDAKGFMAIIQKSVKEGVFSDKGIDAIKEANLRLREMPQATQDALNAIGLDSKKIQSELRNGTKTTFEVIQEISDKLKELPDTSTEVGQALADIFGGPGEDAGLQYLRLLGDIDLSEKGILKNMTNSEKKLYDLQNATKGLQEQTAMLFGVSDWTTMGREIETKVINRLTHWLQILNSISTLFKTGFGDKNYAYNEKKEAEKNKLREKLKVLGEIHNKNNTPTTTTTTTTTTPTTNKSYSKKSTSNKVDLSKVGFTNPLKSNDDSFAKEAEKYYKDIAETKAKALASATEFLSNQELDKSSTYDSAVEQQNIADGNFKPKSFEEQLSYLKQLSDANDQYIAGLEKQKTLLEDIGLTGSIQYQEVSEGLDKAKKKQSKYSKEIGKTVSKQNESNKEADKTQEMGDAIDNVANAVSDIGSAFSAAGDKFELPELNIIGTVGQAIASVALGYANATKSASAEGPWAWIAFAAAGLATMISMIASIKSATSGYAQGGIIGGNTTVGDMNYARVNGGEMILNGSQQANLFSLLNSGGVVSGSNVGISSTVKIKGSDLYIALKNYDKTKANGIKL